MVSGRLELVLQLIDVAYGVSYCVYVYVSLVLNIRRIFGKSRWPLANLLWYWTRWPALVGIILDPIVTVLTDDHLPTWQIIASGVNLVVWWWYRNAGDDDDHKRLKKKIKEKIQQVGSKLVVTPEPAPA